MPELGSYEIRGWKLSALIIAAIPVGFLIHTGNVSYHDARYVRRTEAILVEQAAVRDAEMDARMSVAENAVAENSSTIKEVNKKLAYIEIQSAVSMVRAFQEEYDAHMRRPEDTQEWLRERDSKKRRLEAATKFRDCLMNEGMNCDHLRGW